MKILILVNWKILKLKDIPSDKQSPDYIIEGNPYWFFKYFPNNVRVEAKGISNGWFTRVIERKYLKFYFLQTIQALKYVNKFDLIISHGAQSGILLAFIRRFGFFKRVKHVMIDVGSFNSAKEDGLIHHFIRFASKSIDGLIYHSSSQIIYYRNRFPWLVEKSKFIHFGTDSDFFSPKHNVGKIVENKILCIGYDKRDWDTLINAFIALNDNRYKLKIIGNKNLKVDHSNIELENYIPIQQLIEEILSCKFVVVPLKTFNYSFGQMTVLQSMALQKTVLAAKVPSLIDYIEDGVDGLFYQDEDPIDLLNKMEKLINDDELMYHIGKNARKSIETKINEKEMSKNIYEFVTSLLHNKSQLYFSKEEI